MASWIEGEFEYIQWSCYVRNFLIAKYYEIAELEIETQKDMQ